MFTELLGVPATLDIDTMHERLLQAGARAWLRARLEQLIARIEALPAPPPPMTDMQAARALEQTRLRLPVLGCCSMACTNCSGAREADLRTKLCGGCRVARYCSPGCQNAAWAVHRPVCKALRVEQEQGNRQS